MSTTRPILAVVTLLVVRVDVRTTEPAYTESKVLSSVAHSSVGVNGLCNETRHCP